MLTLPERRSTARPEPDWPTDDRPAYRPFRARVARIETLTAHFRRVTFTGPELAQFGTAGLDQRLKIIFPLDADRFADLGIDDVVVRAEGSWHGRWRALPAGERNPFRTYTVRAARPGEREVDVDFVEHGGSGPAAGWLETAAVGGPVILIGPDARSRHSDVGIDWHPGAARHVLIAGDETAVPAICAILDALPLEQTATVFAEVPSRADVLPAGWGDRVDVTWLPRRGERVGDLLQGAVRGWLDGHRDVVRRAAARVPQPLPDVDVDTETLWESPELPERAGLHAGGGFYAWLAGESALIKALRRCLVVEHGMDRRAVAFMGYWRSGQAERQW